MSKTFDEFLGGKIKLFQPSEGYRAGIDPIFLAAAVKPKPQESILDVGSGVGAASLCLVARCPDVKVTCLDNQQEMVDLAIKNVHANALTNSIDVVHGDILCPPLYLIPHSFDYVMTNPPYHAYERTRSSPIPGKAHAMTETVDLDQWIESCLKMLKPKGTFLMIHRAERLGEILTSLEKRLGDILIYPLWTGPDKPARRVVVIGQKDRKGELSLLPGLVLHRGDEKYTPEAESVLRHAKDLP